MKQITFILLGCCTWWIGSVIASPSNLMPSTFRLTKAVADQPDFIVSDIVGIKDSSCIFSCNEQGTLLTNGQTLYLPQNLPNSNAYTGYVIEFSYTFNPSMKGSFIAWIDCNGNTTISNICKDEGITLTKSPPKKNGQVSELLFTIPNTPFMFRVYEPAGVFAPALAFDMVECIASYCPYTFWASCETAKDSCNIQVLKECRQNAAGAWSAKLTLYYNGLPISNLNDPHCCVTWEYVNGIPSIPCPRPGGFPDQNFTPLTLSEGRHYKVTIVCDSCSYVEEGSVSCTPPLPRPGGAGERSSETSYFSDPAHSVAVYPNPATNHIAIRINQEALRIDSYRFGLFDALGQKVLDHPMQDESKWQILDISSFTPGLYVWRLTSRKGEHPVQMGNIIIVK